MAFLKRITPYAIAVLLLAAFYVPPPLGKTPYEYLRSFSLYRADYLPSVQARPYNYLMFVVQWPFGLCAIQKCTYEPLPDDFKIHGIWPAKNNGDKLKCTGECFNLREMDKQKELQNDLLHSWPDLISSNNMAFWSAEYNKHGRCCDNIIFPQKEYFLKAHDMWSQQRVEEMFKNAGYEPGNSYKLADLQAAVRKKTKKNPALRCRDYTENNPIVKLLLEVVICYDHNGTVVINCNSTLSKSCYGTDTILWKGRPKDV